MKGAFAVLNALRRLLPNHGERTGEGRRTNGWARGNLERRAQHRESLAVGEAIYAYAESRCMLD
jgi:hypothetical protein